MKKRNQINFYRLFNYYLGGQLVSSKEQQITNCIFHTPDNHPSLSINLKKGIYFCHACGEKGNYLSFLRQVNKNNKFKNILENFYD